MKLKNKTVIKNIPTLKCLLELMKENCSEKEYHNWYTARITMDDTEKSIVELLSSDTSMDYIYFENKDRTWNNSIFSCGNDGWKLIDYSDIIRSKQTLDTE